MKTALVIIAVMASACSGNLTEQHVRSSLEATKAAIDPAYAAATDGCIIREQAIEAAMDQGFKPAYEAKAELAEVHAQCEKTRGVFETIRGFYNEAVRLYNDGRFAEALAKYADLTKAWAKLKGGAK